MLIYIIRRLLQGIVLLFMVATVVFILGRLTGNPVDLILPEDATPEDRLSILVTDRPASFQAVSDAITAAGLKPDVAQVSRIPKTTVDLDVDTGRTVLKLMESLDDHDDVQNVSANFNIPDEAMAQINAG